MAAPPPPGVPQALAQSRAQLISNVQYHLALDLKPHAPSLTGHETIEFDLARVPSEPIAIDFRDLTPQGDIADGRISNFRLNAPLNSSAITPEQGNGHIMMPPSMLRAGANRAELDFESAIATSNRAITRTIDPLDSNEYIYTLFVPMDASLAFPCFDQPDLKARFTLEMSAPASWTVISNTSGRTENGHTRFEETHPISTYLFAFAAGPFEQLPGPPGDVALRLFVRKSVLARAKEEWPEIARYTREGMQRMSAFFDQPYPFPKYDQVLIPGFAYGGMEHAGATFFREDGMLFRSAPNITDHQRRSVTVLHELAHQWFGDLVTMRWFDDLWLKEGFAQYMAFHTLAEFEPPAEVWKRFYESIKPIAYNIDSTQGTVPIYQQVRNLADAKSAYGPIVYQKAPGLLRVLNYRIGEEGFRGGIRIFLRDHAYANATWQDLIGAFSTASKQDLRPWANAWVTQRGMPVVTLKWACSAGQLSSLEISQHDSLNENHLWPISTQLLLGSGAGAPARTLDVSFDTAQSKLAARGACPDYIFGNSGDHAYGRFLLDAKSIAGVQAAMPLVADPLERALHWGALWDTVRETEMAPAAYADFAIRSLPSEGDLDITQSVVGRAHTAIVNYLNDAQRKAPLEKYETLLMDRMKNSASRDFRIAYFRAFVGAASTPAALAELNKLLAGTSAISGVALQQRDRWNIIATLVHMGDPEALSLLAVERKRDLSEDGKRSAYAALAGVATAGNKQKYFADYLKDGAVPEDFVTASLGNFNAWNQKDLTLKYLRPALDALPQVKRQRKIFFVNGWLSSFVASQTSLEAQKLVNEFLARQDLDPDLRLKILEVKDDLDRTVRIRARWK